MARERLPAYCLHKASGQAVVRIDGKDIYLGKYGTPASRIRYDRVIAEWLANGRRFASGERFTIAMLLAQYWEWAEGYYSRDEARTIKKALGEVRRLYQDIPAEEFGPLALKAVRRKMIERGWVRTSINRHVERIKRMFKWAVANELVPPATYEALRSVPGLRRGEEGASESEPVGPVSEADMRAIEPYVRPQVWAMVQLQWLTGMRPGEVRIMRGCDIDVTGEIWLYRPYRHKTERFGHERIIELGPRAQEVLRPWLRAEVQKYLFSPAEAVAELNAERRRNRKTPISRRGQSRKRESATPRNLADCYSMQSYEQAIARGCRKAGIERWHPHQLRHAFATRIRREAGLEAARILLGHRSMAVSEVYAEIDRAAVREVVKRLG